MTDPHTSVPPVPTADLGGDLDVVRAHAEVAYAHELAALERTDQRPRPPHWRLSPWAVVTYLLGGTLADGTVITPKYIGPRRLIEIAVATLATDRALLLLGLPGTAKTWVSEHLAAAISGNSTLLVQGTAGTAEEAVRYGWNYARLLAEGPSAGALVPSPVFRAHAAGVDRARRGTHPHARATCRTRSSPCSARRRCPSPSSAARCRPGRGFNLIATANNRDRGVNELSSALRRRFNTVVLPHAGDGRGRGAHRQPARGRSSVPRSALPAGCGAGRRDPPGRHRVPRAALRPERGRPDQVQDAVGHDEHRRGDLGDRAGDVDGRAPRRRRAALRRPARRHRGDASSRTRCTTPSCGASTSTPSPPAERRPTATSTTRRCHARWTSRPRRPRIRLLGIRHHGPGSARAVRRALARVAARRRADRRAGRRRRRARARRHPTTCSPPVAMLGYVVDRPERAVFSPFASFSPEWVALRWALRRRRAGAVHRPAVAPHPALAD